MLVEKQMCSGCGTCAAVCPKQCITMSADGEGFRYPCVDTTVCVQCGLCEHSCPIVNKPITEKQTQAFAVKSKEDGVRERSSSGGVFSHLAEYVLANGGYVCGAAYEKDFKVRHRLIGSKEQLDLLRRAKYSQSEAEQCFKNIQNHLKDGKTVLFVGTPCQTAGLQTYLQKPYETLILVDMICHGVPSPLVWKHYVSERQKQDAPHAAISFVNMRSKASGWSRYSYSFEMGYDDNNVYRCIQGQDWFMNGFTQNLFLRPSCEKCSFKGVGRSSDFTLGDYWGVWDQYPTFDDNKGVSLLLIHSDKGRRLYKQLPMLESMEIDIEQALVQNPSALTSSKPHANRELFFGLIKKHKSVINSIRDCLLPKQPSLWKRLLRKMCGK